LKETTVVYIVTNGEFNDQFLQNIQLILTNIVTNLACKQVIFLLLINSETFITICNIDPVL